MTYPTMSSSPVKIDNMKIGVHRLSEQHFELTLKLNNDESHCGYAVVDWSNDASLIAITGLFAYMHGIFKAALFSAIADDLKVYGAMYYLFQSMQGKILRG